MVFSNRRPPLDQFFLCHGSVWISNGLQKPSLHAGQNIKYFWSASYLIKTFHYETPCIYTVVKVSRDRISVLNEQISLNVTMCTQGYEISPMGLLTVMGPVGKLLFKKPLAWAFKYMFCSIVNWAHWLMRRTYIFWSVMCPTSRGICQGLKTIVNQSLWHVPTCMFTEIEKGLDR